MRAIDPDRLKKNIEEICPSPSSLMEAGGVLQLVDRGPTVSITFDHDAAARRIAELEVKVTELTAALAYETHELEGFKRRVKGRLERLGAMMVETIVEEMR